MDLRYGRDGERIGCAGERHRHRRSSPGANRRRRDEEESQEEDVRCVASGRHGPPVGEDDWQRTRPPPRLTRG